MMNNNGIPVPNQFAAISMHMLAPKREVIVDMVMVQIICAILVFTGVLIFRSSEITQLQMSSYMFSILIAFVLLTGIYQRITRPA